MHNQTSALPGVYNPARQGQATIKDVSGLSMKTGRAMPLQIVTDGEVRQPHAQRIP